MQTPRNKSRAYVGKYYEISEEVLGRGSFSTVYLARHKIFGTKVALKIIDTNQIQEEYVLKNLSREAKILRKLNHPNIVNFYEEFQHSELYCLAMEHINGPDLSHYLRKQEDRRVSEKIAKVLFYQMVSAVHHMHRTNILHRDLKQENILLEYGRVIKIVDFGLSNTYQPTVQLRTHCGSLVYAAPELFQQWSVYGAGVDLWSLGVILYSMVVGSMPFDICKDIKSSISQSKRERFLKRISKGLTEENWENMGNLSYDCSNLLEKLLQPDQFKRIRIEGVRQHPWFLKDEGLRKRVPQHRTDLKCKFESEVIDIMADRLHQPKERIRLHLSTRDKYDRVSAMFFILQDTLVKEVLYPPKDLQNSFIFQLECRRKSQFSVRKKTVPLVEQAEKCDSENENSELSGGRSSRSLQTDGSTFVSHNFIRELPRKPEIQGNKKGFGEGIKSIRKRIGDGQMENKTSEQIITPKKPWMPTSNNILLKAKSSIYHGTDDQSRKSTVAKNEPVYSNRYRSYQNSRPTRVVKDLVVTPRNEERNEMEKRSEENSYHEIGVNRNNFSKYTGKSNFQGQVQLLKQKFENNCVIDSRNVEKRENNLRNQRKLATSASNPAYYPRNSVKRSTDVDNYTVEQIALVERTYDMRTNTNERSIKSSEVNPIHNNRSYQKSSLNPTAQSKNLILTPQMKQKSRIIRRSNAPNSSHLTNKDAENRLQCGTQKSYGQCSTIYPSMNKSNYGSRKSYKATPSATTKRENPSRK